MNLKFKKKNCFLKVLSPNVVKTAVKLFYFLQIFKGKSQLGGTSSDPKKGDGFQIGEGDWSIFLPDGDPIPSGKIPGWYHRNENLVFNQ